jgi:spore maturation protein CgeB
MKVVFFYHSLLSDWNHGNAHFLRGIAKELLDRGHEIEIYEPAGGWSLTNLLREQGESWLLAFSEAYPGLSSNLYKELRLEKILADADLVLVHEWNCPELVSAIGVERNRSPHFKLLFHDTHHRAVSSRKSMESYGLQFYDGVLAYGRVLRNLYIEAGWTRRAWVWHEAADTRIFHPQYDVPTQQDLVWVGNWGDDERAAELTEYFVEPARKIGCGTSVYGVRYPNPALVALKEAGINFRGWLANFNVPKAFAASRVTVHVPRRPYATTLPGIPTIRPFEALACGIPLVTSYWEDAEELFLPGKDYLVAHNGDEMKKHLRAILSNEELATDLISHGLQTIRLRHTCLHRVDELLEIHSQLIS